MAQADGVALRAQHDFVQGAEGRREDAVVGPDARDVGHVGAARLGAGVDEDAGVGEEQRVVGGVVDRAPPRVAGDDGDVGVLRGAVAGERVGQVGGEGGFGCVCEGHGGG